MFIFEVVKLFQNMEITSLVCKYTKNHKTVYFKWMNCMVNKLYLNKAV